MTIFKTGPPSKAMSHSSGLNSAVDVQVIVTDGRDTDVDKVEHQRPAYVAVGLILAMTATTVLLPLLLTSRLFGLNVSLEQGKNVPCTEPCSISLVESIPENLTYPAGSPSHPSTYATWKQLVASANETISIASFYWTLRGSDVFEDPSDWQGEDIYADLLRAGTERNIKIRIVQSVPEGSTSTDQDTKDLVSAGAAEVRSINFTRLVGAGILHTKLWIVDGEHVYMGSANMDWRSLTQVKEMGAAVMSCSCIAADMQKIFEAYWYLAQDNVTIPPHWPAHFNTAYNSQSPMQLVLNATNATAYISSSPPEFCPAGRTGDIDAILSTIAQAQHFVYIAVMDYLPITIYTKTPQFWPRIDDALRAAAIERRVSVRVMASWWNHSRAEMAFYLKSLADLGNIHNVDVQVKLFEVPASEAQKKIPFGRVNHNKYMVTDKVAYIGTSNWSGDYFISTGGVGLIVNQTEAASARNPQTEGSTIQEQLRAVFDRDWNSTYAHSLSHFMGQARAMQRHHTVS